MSQSTLRDYQLDGTERQALRDEIRRAVGMVDHDNRDDRLRKFELLAVVGELDERPHHEVATAKLRLLLARIVGLDREAYESGQTFKRRELLAIRDALD